VDPAVLQHQLGGFAGPQAHLFLQLADRKPGSALLDHEGPVAGPPQGRVDGREDDHPIGPRAVGDVAFSPIEDVMVAVLLGGRLESSDVAARLGFGEAVGAPVQLLFPLEGRKKPLLLFFGAGQADRRAAQARAGQREDQRRVAPRHLLGPDHRRAVGLFGATHPHFGGPIFGFGGALGDAHLLQLEQEGVGEVVLPIGRQRQRADLVFGEPVGELTDVLLSGR
jgi:hypothetical protein